MRLQPRRASIPAMKHAVIFAHPKTVRSFTAAAADAYARACRKLGHEAIVRDLYGTDFDPRLRPGEIPFAPGFAPGADVEAERDLLRDCDVFAFFYPLWLNAPPAMMKGYLERVFGFGFAYGSGGRSYSPLLAGRKLISFSSSGAPHEWIEQTGALGAVCLLFDNYFASLCGLAVLDHIHTGSVTPDASETFVQARLRHVEDAVARHFGTRSGRTT
jgi:NAD(P)H dehydrogenase (quinone)